MISSFTIVLFISIFQSMVLFDFTSDEGQTGWTIVNDNVMGGRSRSSFSISDQGTGIFKGTVSLENNGGFCSVRHGLDAVPVQRAEKFVIRLKGDGKKYQFRLKAKRSDYHSYIAWFETSGEWETIEIPMKDMFPRFRGRNLDMPNFSGESIDEIGILIGNKKAESFNLEIDKISLK